MIDGNADATPANGNRRVRRMDCVPAFGVVKGGAPGAVGPLPESRFPGPQSAMNWADYCIAGILVLSILMGLWRGLIGEVLALVCWAVALWVAWRFGPQVAEQFKSIDLPAARLLLGYILCFVAVLIAGAIVGFFFASSSAAAAFRAPIACSA